MPLDPPSNAEHDNGAIGVEYIRLLATDTELGALRARLTTILGHPPDKDGAWTLQTPNGRAPRLLASLSTSEKERAWLEERGREVGLYEVGFRVQDGVAGAHDTPFGRLTFTA